MGSKSDRTRSRTYIVAFVVFLILFYSLNVVLLEGVIPIPQNAIFLHNYDEIDSLKTWQELVSKYPSLQTEKAPWLRREKADRDVVLTLNTGSSLEEIAYPKEALLIYVTLEVRRGRLTQPHLLILVLDQNERIRGKIFSSFALPDVASEQTATAKYWFNVPEDIQGRQFRVVGEIFGSWSAESSSTIFSGNLNVETFVSGDDVYGLLPAWDYSGGYMPPYPRYALLDLDSLIETAPESKISYRNLFSAASVAATLISAVIVGFSLNVPRIAKVLKERPDLIATCFFLVVALGALVLILVLRVAFG